MATDKEAVPRVVYYENELTDEFSTAKIKARTIDGRYTYLHRGPLWRLWHFFLYRILAFPLALLYLKLKFGHRIKGAEALRDVKGGYFLYGNHTQAMADPLIPQMLNPRRDKYVVVHPANVSMPLLGRLTPALGALPLPDTLEAAKHFMGAIETRLQEGAGVVIYPEAHIWPYYTGIRPFPDASFRYPVKHGTPVFAFTNTYRQRRWRKTPRIVTMVRGPFLPDPTLPPAAARKALRDRVYEAMCADAALSDAVVVEYRKKPADGAENRQQSPERSN